MITQLQAIHLIYYITLTKWIANLPVKLAFTSKYVNWKAKIQTSVSDTVILYSFIS